MAVKIESSPENAKEYGKHFDDQHDICSKVSIPLHPPLSPFPPFPFFFEQCRYQENLLIHWFLYGVKNYLKQIDSLLSS